VLEPGGSLLSPEAFRHYTPLYTPAVRLFTQVSSHLPIAAVPKFSPHTDNSRSALTRVVLEPARSAEAPLRLPSQQEKLAQAVNQEVPFLNVVALQHGCRHQKEFTHLYCC